MLETDLSLLQRPGSEITFPPDGAPELRPVVKAVAVRDLGEVSIEPLVALISRMSDKFWASQDAVKENDFSVFHSTRHVILRFPLSVHDPRAFCSHVAWAMLRSVVEPLLRQAVTPYRFSKPIFPKAMLARVKAGGIVDPHWDSGRANVVTHKIHVPLQTGPLTTFEVGDESFHLARGRAYEVNNLARHSVRNPGELDRIHLIFEVFEGAQLR